jgi:hypothetical protein
MATSLVHIPGEPHLPRIMALTLWRGAQLLGDIHVRSIDRGHTLNGVLLPAEGHPPLAIDWQAHIPLPSGPIVRRLHVPPFDGIDTSPSSPSVAAATSVMLAPESESNVAEIPLAEQFRIEQDGAPLSVGLVSLFEFRLGHAVPQPPEVELLPDDAVHEGSVWLVVVGLMPSSFTS